MALPDAGQTDTDIDIDSTEYLSDARTFYSHTSHRHPDCVVSANFFAIVLSFIVRGSSYISMVHAHSNNKNTCKSCTSPSPFYPHAYDFLKKAVCHTHQMSTYSSLKA